MSEHTAEEDAPVALVRAMVRLAETLGHALPWANLTDACAGLASPVELRRAVDSDSAIEVTPKGLRFSLGEPAPRNHSTTTADQEADA